MLPIRGYPLKKFWYRMEAVADMDYTVVDNELEARYEKYRGVLKNLTLMSDVFMRNVFKSGNAQNMFCRLSWTKKI